MYIKKIVLLLSVISIFYTTKSYAISFDEAYDLALKNNFIVKKIEYDGLYYKKLESSLSRFVNISYSLKSMFSSLSHQTIYSVTNQIDPFNYTKIKQSAYDTYYQANNSLLFQNKRNLLNTLSEIYFNLLLNQLQYETSLKNIKSNEELLKDTKTLKDNGKVAYIDTILAQTFLNEMLAKSSAYAEQINGSKNRLKELVGKDTLEVVEPSLPKVKKQDFYLKEYIENDPNVKFYQLTNKAIELDKDYDLKTYFFKPQLNFEMLSEKTENNNLLNMRLNLGIGFSGNYNPNYLYQNTAREEQILSNTEQIKNITRDDKLFVYQIYQNILVYEKTYKILEENKKLMEDALHRMEEGYKVRYVNLIDLLKVKNEYINNLYAINENKINLLKNTILLEKLTDKSLYAN